MLSSPGCQVTRLVTYKDLLSKARSRDAWSPPRRFSLIKTLGPGYHIIPWRKASPQRRKAELRTCGGALLYILRAALRIRKAGRQVTRTPGYHVTRLPGCQVTRTPGYHVTKLPGHQVTRTPGYHATKLLGHQVTRTLSMIRRNGGQRPSRVVFGVPRQSGVSVERLHVVSRLWGKHGRAGQ